MRKVSCFNAEGFNFPEYLPEVGDVVQVIELKDFCRVHETSVIGRRLMKNEKKVYRDYYLSLESKAFFFSDASTGRVSIHYRPASSKSKGATMTLTYCPGGKEKAESVPCEIKIIRKARQE